MKPTDAKFPIKSSDSVQSDSSRDIADTGDSLLNQIGKSKNSYSAVSTYVGNKDMKESSNLSFKQSKYTVSMSNLSKNTWYKNEPFLSYSDHLKQACYALGDVTLGLDGKNNRLPYTLTFIDALSHFLLSKTESSFAFKGIGDEFCGEIKLKKDKTSLQVSLERNPVTETAPISIESKELAKIILNGFENFKKSINESRPNSDSDYQYKNTLLKVIQEIDTNFSLALEKMRSFN